MTIDPSSPRQVIDERAPHFAELFLWNVRSLSGEFAACLGSSACLSRGEGGQDKIPRRRHSRQKTRIGKPIAIQVRAMRGVSASVDQPCSMIPPMRQMGPR